MSDDLEERLKGHARAFDGLLSLIPAKLYYGEDNSDQWQRKKQTKEQKKEARRAKLDPDNVKSAKDVMDERAAAAKKRKREEIDTEGPDSATQVATAKSDDEMDNLQQKVKKQKTTTPTKTKTQPNEQATETSEEERRRRKAEKKAAKKERKQVQKDKAKAKRERQKARKAEATSNEPPEADGSEDDVEEDSTLGQDTGDLAEAIDIQNELPEPQEEAPSTASPSPEPQLSRFDSPQNHSTSSSISSIQPPTNAAEPKLAPSDITKPITQSKPSASEIRERLQSRIEALRAARKADGPDGRPARSRQELLEARRKKEEERKAHKKELRRKAKEEEARQRDEEIAARFSPGGSGSLLASPRSPMLSDAGSTASNNYFTFGRVAFNDGTQAASDLSNLSNPSASKKGTSDARTALDHATRKASRLSNMSDTQRADIAQKDMWLNARKRAHGEKVKDDTSLLKKALKRQDAKKGKSEKEWKDRQQGVEKGIKDRQKKREENLKKRKEEKGSKGGKGKSGGKVKRPGFEGSFRAKHGKK